MNGPNIKTISFSIAFILSTSTLIDRAQGQQDSGRRQFVQSLLQTFIESQLPKEKTSPPSPSSTTTNRSTLPSGSGSLDTAQIREASRVLSMASNEMQQLVGALQNDLFRAQGVRQLLSLAFSGQLGRCCSGSTTGVRRQRRIVARAVTQSGRGVEYAGVPIEQHAQPQRQDAWSY